MFNSTPVLISYRVTDPYRRLLEVAKAFAAGDAPRHYGPAVVLAQSACEVCTQNTLELLFTEMGIGHLFGPFEEFVATYNLASSDPKLRKMYTALSGDQIAETPFWAQLVELPKKRNRIAHHGEDVSKEEAQRLCEAAESLLNHLDTITARFLERVATPYAARNSC